MGRVEAWRTSFNIATQRVTGGGFSSIEHDFVAQAYPTVGGLTQGRAAHSMYFQVLGDHGFIGLALYLAAIGSALFITFLVLQATRGRPDLRWANQLGRMLQASIAAYMFGGAALSMAYYDGFLIIVVLAAALYQVVKHSSTATDAVTRTPKWKAVEAASPARPALP
jgi:probable O-glycosylation ligase (exosortase A-associated)